MPKKSSTKRRLRNSEHHGLLLRFFQLLWRLAPWILLLLVVRRLPTAAAQAQEVEVPASGRSQADIMEGFARAANEVREFSPAALTLVNACQHPGFQPANKIPGAEYVVIKIQKQKLALCANRLFVNDELIKLEWRNDKLLSALEAHVAKHLPEHNKQIGQLLLDISAISPKEDAINNILITSLMHATVALEIGTMICGTSVFLTIGKLMADHVLNGTPLPTLIRAGIRFDADEDLYEVMARKNIHILANHQTLWIAPHASAEQEKLTQEIDNVLIYREGLRDELAKGKPVQNQIDKFSRVVMGFLPQLDLQVCDAWMDDQRAYTSARPPQHPLSVVKSHPELLGPMHLITSKDLQTPSGKIVADYVFRQHEEVWNKLLAPQDTPRAKMSF